MTDASLEQNKQYLNSVIIRLKNGINKTIRGGRYDTALSLISACAAVQYKGNQCYSDESLERALCAIAGKILPSVQTETVWDKSKILFYDGFGMNSRGLIRIYLKALCKLGRVTYVTDVSHKENLPDVLDILYTAGAEVVWLTKSKPTAAIEELYDIFLQKKPGTAFLYTRPEDVVSTAVFSRMEGIVSRFQINLTDHAFWLGTCALDYCIEFRDYGAVASVQGRGIPAEKLVKLPFYPLVDRDRVFEGFPFPFDPASQKLIFSGGSLYKTLGGGNRYYELVEYILDTYPETVFWYAGSGNRAQMDKLLYKYPARAFLTEERQDFFQVMEHSFFYLSTYPVTGGLMFQYAALAGKLPVTLRFDSEADGYLLDQQNLGLEAENMEQAKALLHRVFADETFRREKERQIKSAVINEEIFLQQLHQIIAAGKSAYPVEFYQVDVTDLRNEYLAACNLKSVASVLARKEFAVILPYLPLEFGAAVLKIVRDKLLRN